MRGAAVRTTVPGRATPRPADRGNRRFQAPRPNAPRVADFTHVATRQGFVHAAFVVDALARPIVGRRVPRTAHARASSSTPWSGRPMTAGPAKAPASFSTATAGSGPCRSRIPSAPPGPGSSRPSAASATATTARPRGRSSASTRPRFIRRLGPWRSLGAVEFATLEWVDRFNQRRPLDPRGGSPPAEAGERYRARTEPAAEAA